MATSHYTVTVRIAHLHAGRTSCLYRRYHLLSLLSSDSLTFHVTRDQPNVSPPYGASPISTSIPTITAGHSLLSARQSSPPSACLAVRLPRGRRYWVPTFRIIDHLGDLGVPRTPVVQRFRTSTLETCNLTTSLHTGERIFDLLVLLGLSLVDDAADIHIHSPYHPSLALNRRELPDGSACHH